MYVSPLQLHVYNSLTRCIVVRLCCCWTSWLSSLYQYNCPIYHIQIEHSVRLIHVVQTKAKEKNIAGISRTVVHKLLMLVHGGSIGRPSSGLKEHPRAVPENKERSGLFDLRRRLSDFRLGERFAFARNPNFDSAALSLFEDVGRLSVFNLFFEVAGQKKLFQEAEALLYRGSAGGGVGARLGSARAALGRLGGLIGIDGTVLRVGPDDRAHGFVLATAEMVRVPNLGRGDERGGRVDGDAGRG